MLKRQASGFACILLGGCLLGIQSGCSVPQRVYEGVQLGRSVPGPDDSRFPSGLLRSAWGLSLAESVQSAFPWVTEVKETRAATDPNGNVFAKSFASASGAHYLLLVVSGDSFTVEVEIPAQYFNEPPPNWKVGSCYSGLNKQRFLAPAMNLGKKIAGDTTSNLWPWSKYDSPVAEPPALRVGVWKRIFAWSKGWYYEAYSDVCDDAVADPALQNVGAFLAYSLLMLDNVPLHVKSQPEPRLMFGNAADNIFSLSDVFDYLFKHEGVLSGITAPGYDKHFRGGPINRHDIRVRNLGNHRIRLEAGQGYVLDPVFAPLFSLSLGLAEGTWPSKPDR